MSAWAAAREKAKRDRVRVAELVLQRVPNVVIAEVLGITPKRVCIMRAQMGCPMGKGTSKAEAMEARIRLGLMAGPMPAPAPPVSEIGPEPVGRAFDWTPQRDGAVLATQGRYAKISELAARWDMSSARIVARWHLLRQGCGPMSARDRRADRGAAQGVGA